MLYIFYLYYILSNVYYTFPEPDIPVTNILGGEGFGNVCPINENG